MNNYIIPSVFYFMKAKSATRSDDKAILHFYVLF